MPLPDSYQIPKSLCGLHRICRPKWQRITKRAVAARSWDEALKKCDWIGVDQAPGALLMLGAWTAVEPGENTRLYLVQDLLFDALWMATPTGEEMAVLPTVRELFLTGSQNFWFCLSLLPHFNGIMPRREELEEANKSLCRDLARNVLVWWPQFCSLDMRFQLGLPSYRGWPNWSHGIGCLCLGAGMEDEEFKQLAHVGPREAGEKIKDWLAAS